jgi:hypothetical protein
MQKRLPAILLTGVLLSISAAASLAAFSSAGDATPTPTTSKSNRREPCLLDEARQDLEIAIVCARDHRPEAVRLMKQGKPYDSLPLVVGVTADRALWVSKKGIKGGGPYRVQSISEDAALDLQLGFTSLREDLRRVVIDDSIIYLSLSEMFLLEKGEKYYRHYLYPNSSDTTATLNLYQAYIGNAEALIVEGEHAVHEPHPFAFQWRSESE